MLITHMKPDELWGKKVFDSRGHILGEVVAISSHRGVVHKVVVRRTPEARAGRPVSSMIQVVGLGDEMIVRRARLAERLTQVIEADQRVQRCRRIVFTHEGGALLEVELVHDFDAASRETIGRELESSIRQAVVALPWSRIHIV
jgi:sporulation protein YlmC with PRC-barrel domain